jgi:cephalosporin-C deacetylase-like acetyl esterase
MRFAAIFLLATALAAAADNPQDRFLKYMDRIAIGQLDRRAQEIARVRTAAEAGRRQQATRAKVLELIGGLPDYKGPLNARTTGKIDHGSYVIEKVIFESLPRIWVTANLYLPTSAGRHPAVLYPLGHWDNGKPAVQVIAANLALKGFAVLAYDPLGQGERLQAYDARLGASLAGGSVYQHFMAGAQSVAIGQSFARHRIWDAKRALDYLTSRPEVDSGRIGCTGCSGGGTIATYISALDPRIKVAAPSCYMNSFRALFAGPVGDSEQSVPGFLSSGLDQTDYVEMFAPKPWLIVNTIDDFFKLEGARQVFEEARGWYRVYGAEDKIAWAIGHGGHGTPLEVREAIYRWFIRWLKDGQGDGREQTIEKHPDFELLATRTGQVATSLDSRDINAFILEEYRAMRKPGTREEMMAALRGFSGEIPSDPPGVRTLERIPGAVYDTERLLIESEPGLELEAVLLTPRAGGRKPAVVSVETQAGPSPAAISLAEKGAVVLALNPRNLPLRSEYPMMGDWLGATRAWLTGRNLPGMRAFDIRRGVDLLCARPQVDASRVTATARGVSGVWLLIAAALDARIRGVWLDRTPAGFRQAMENPLHRDLHEAVMPGFALRWDFDDIAKAVAPRTVLWSDPSDWMGAVLPLGAPYLYRPFEVPDDPYIERLLKP